MSETKKQEPPRPLDLSTQRERPKVRIDGVEYELVRPDDLTVSQALWLEKIAPKVDRLAKEIRDQGFDEAKAEELGREILKVSDIILGEVPAEVRARLTEMQKLIVIQAYIAVSGGFAGFFAESPGGGPPSSRGSEGSMGETPTTGAP